jgi:tetratricopeptide (TPR) repeat protein
MTILLISLLIQSGCSQFPTGSSDYNKRLETASQYLAEGNAEEAIIELEKAIAFEPEKAKAYVKLAQLHLDDKEYEEASKILLDGFERNKESQEIGLLCVDVEIYLGHLESAKSVLTTLNQAIGETEMTKLRMENINRLIEEQAAREAEKLKEEAATLDSESESVEMHEFSIEATSFSRDVSQGVERYNKPENMFDDNLLTIWAEDDPGNGVGQKIIIKSKPAFDLGTLSLTNGFAYDEEFYYNNNRLLKLKVSSDKGDWKIVDFSDGVLQMQEVTIGFKDVDELTLEVLEIKQGEVFNDLCISEMRINSQLAIKETTAGFSEVSEPEVVEEVAEPEVVEEVAEPEVVEEVVEPEVVEEVVEPEVVEEVVEPEVVEEVVEPEVVEEVAEPEVVEEVVEPEVVEEVAEPEVVEEVAEPEVVEEVAEPENRVVNIRECILEASEYLFDNKLETAWSEQTPGDGVGEKIIIKSNSAFALQTLSLVNGYAKNEDKYYQNNRVIKLKISSDQGDEKIVTFSDDFMDFQEVVVGFRRVEELTLEVLETSKGNKYNDLCISEIKINGQTPKVK